MSDSTNTADVLRAALRRAAQDLERETDRRLVRRIADDACAVEALAAEIQAHDKPEATRAQKSDHAAAAALENAITACEQRGFWTTGAARQAAVLLRDVARDRRIPDRRRDHLEPRARLLAGVYRALSKALWVPGARCRSGRWEPDGAKRQVKLSCEERRALEARRILIEKLYGRRHTDSMGAWRWLVTVPPWAAAVAAVACDVAGYDFPNDGASRRAALKAALREVIAEARRRHNAARAAAGLPPIAAPQTAEQWERQKAEARRSESLAALRGR